LIACKEGNVSGVEELVKAWGKANLMEDFGTSSLVVACDEGHYSIIEDLLKTGTQVFHHW
jgi:hypothetical protein